MENKKYNTVNRFSYNLGNEFPQLLRIYISICTVYFVLAHYHPNIRSPNAACTQSKLSILSMGFLNYFNLHRMTSVSAHSGIQI